MVYFTDISCQMLRIPQVPLLNDPCLTLDISKPGGYAKALEGQETTIQPSARL